MDLLVILRLADTNRLLMTRPSASPTIRRTVIPAYVHPGTDDEVCVVAGVTIWVMAAVLVTVVVGPERSMPMIEQSQHPVGWPVRSITHVGGVCKTSAGHTETDTLRYLGVGFKLVFLISDSQRIHSSKCRSMFDKNAFPEPDSVGAKCPRLCPSRFCSRRVPL